jgi:hypothetical protein
MGIAENFFGKFLTYYLIYLIVACLFTSIITVVSRSIIPKLVNILGIILWFYFSYHPKVSIKTIDREMLK